MKKFYYVAILAMATFTTFVFQSCSNDDDDVEPGKGTPSTEAGLLDKSSGLRVRSVGDYSFEYDSKGRLDYVSEGSNYGYKFSYNPNKVTRESYGEEKESYSVGYNSNGYLSSFSYKDSDEDGSETGTASLSYDDDGHLTQISSSYQGSFYEKGKQYNESETASATLTWKSSRVTKIVLKYSGTEGDGDRYSETQTWTYEYSDYTMENYYNKYLQWTYTILRALDIEGPAFMAYVGLFGKGSKYLPSGAERVRVEIENGEEERREYSYSFSYGFNNNGSLSYCNYDGSRYNYTYGFSDSNSRQAPAVTPIQTKSQDTEVLKQMRGFFYHHRNRK